MGLIEKQATRNTILSYLGAILGAITVLWSSYLFTPSENGVTRILLSYSILFAQFANLGFTSITNRFFPYFRNKEKGHHGFLWYGLIVSGIGFIICCLAFIFLYPYIIEKNQIKSPLFVTYIAYIIPLFLFIIFYNLFDAYLRASFNSVIGTFAKDVIQRIVILGCLFLYFLNIINFQIFILLYVLATALPTFILLYQIIRQGEWHIKRTKGFLTNELRNDIIKLGLLSILAGGASAIVANIDTIMVNGLLGERSAGIYGISFYFGTIILIPARSIYRITSNVIAENFKHNQLEHIHKLYNQSCNGQLAIGLFLFIGIYTNIDNIMQFLPPEYAGGRSVILILSFAYLIEMATGINQIILINSENYRFDLFVVILIVAATLLGNYILIPIYGIIGSALATTISFIVGNGLRYFVLFYKYNMQPYDTNTVKLLLIAAITFLPAYLLPSMPNVYLDILARGSMVTLLFTALILKTDATPDLNQKIRKNLLILRKK